MVLIKLPQLKCQLLASKLAKGIGHNTYGEPAWPNDILYIFPIVILGIFQLILGLAVYEPLGLGDMANPFATPSVILPEWYFFPTFNLLRVIPNKLAGVLGILALLVIFLMLPFIENTSRYQNPLRRPIALSVFLSAIVYSLWLM